MKSIILDENIPRKLRTRLSGYRVTTVPERGWGGVKNGRLMALIDGGYDVFVTADKNLRYQQNLDGRKISIIEVPFNDSAKLLPLAPAILLAIEQSLPGSYIEIAPPPSGASSTMKINSLMTEPYPTPASTANRTPPSVP